MSWRSWSGEFIERGVVFHVEQLWLWVWGVLLGIGDGAFNGVFHVKRGSLFGMIRWD